ncbi:excalibur calcium-binding domain-containing protein [Bacillus cytotoxicus]
MFSALTFLFLLFSVLAIIALIVGLIKPGKVIRFGNKKTRGLVILIFLPILFISFILTGVFANKSINPEERAAIDKKRTEEKVLKEKQEQEKSEKEKEAKEEKKAAEEKRKLEEAQKQEEQRKLEEAQKQEEQRKQQEVQKQQESTSKSTISNSGANESFSNCTELRKKYPNGVPSSHPAYSAKLDRDKDGFACEKN